MKLRRPRFTVRWLMLAVAIFGVIVWSGHMWIRSRDFLARSDFHRFKADIFRGRAEHDAGLAGVDPSRIAEIVERDLRLERHDSDLAHKNERAARYPWLHVAPDTPDPE